jgi:hypothetical protein
MTRTRKVNLFVILSIIINGMALDMSSKQDSKIDPSKLITQHGNLVCKKEIEAQKIKTTQKGNLFSENVRK